VGLHTDKFLPPYSSAPEQNCWVLLRRIAIGGAVTPRRLRGVLATTLYVLVSRWSEDSKRGLISYYCPRSMHQSTKYWPRYMRIGVYGSTNHQQRLVSDSSKLQFVIGTPKVCIDRGEVLGCWTEGVGTTRCGPGRWAAQRTTSHVPEPPLSCVTLCNPKNVVKTPCRSWQNSARCMSLANTK
jgi:hypothetical protein